ncbi:acyltransferase family protein [Sphingobium sp. AN641]|uniref:acyltransferase family protein n=1 Tax=Sphingobium sp. AN641 TaxID=3133443 RepID=UPI0030C41675
MGERGSNGVGRDRLGWVDVARGIGIVAVVAGHAAPPGALRDMMYSFHMPLFFILSGMLTRPRPVGEFTRHQLAQLRPYAIFLILLLTTDLLVETMKGGRPIFHDWPADILPVLTGGTALRGPYTIFWFVPCLMVARILINGILVRWPEPQRGAWLVIVPAALMLAYGLGAWTDTSVLGLLTVPMALALLWVGLAWERTSWHRWMVVPLVLLSLPSLMLVFPSLNMKIGDYGWPIASMAGAIATSLLIFRVSLSLLPQLGWLAVPGRASLVIMYLHVALIHYLTPYLDRWLIFGIALLVPVMIDRLIRASAIATRWML